MASSIVSSEVAVVKTSRYGRILKPPLAHWANQHISYDAYGNAFAISEGDIANCEVRKLHKQLAAMADHYKIIHVHQYNTRSAAGRTKETQISKRSGTPKTVRQSLVKKKPTKTPRKGGRKPRRKRETNLDRSRAAPEKRRSSRIPQVVAPKRRKISPNQSPAVRRTRRSVTKIDPDQSLTTRRTRRSVTKIYPDQSPPVRQRRRSFRRVVNPDQSPAGRPKRKRVGTRSSSGLNHPYQEPVNKVENTNVTVSRHTKSQATTTVRKLDVCPPAGNAVRIEMPVKSFRNPGKRVLRSKAKSEWQETEIKQLRIAVDAAKPKTMAEWKSVALSLGTNKSAADCRHYAINMIQDERKRDGPVSRETKSTKTNFDVVTLRIQDECDQFLLPTEGNQAFRTKFPVTTLSEISFTTPSSMTSVQSRFAARSVLSSTATPPASVSDVYVDPDIQQLAARHIRLLKPLVKEKIPTTPKVVKPIRKISLLQQSINKLPWNHLNKSLDRTDMFSEDSYFDLSTTE